MGFLPLNALIQVMSQFSLIALLASNSLNFYGKSFKCLAGYLGIKKSMTLYIARESSWTLTGGNMTPTAHEPKLTLNTHQAPPVLLWSLSASNLSNPPVESRPQGPQGPGAFLVSHLWGQRASHGNNKFCWGPALRTMSTSQIIPVRTM